MFFNDVFVRWSIPVFVEWLWKFNTNKGLFSCLVDRPSSFLCTSQLFMENLTSKHNICAKLIAEHNVTFFAKIAKGIFFARKFREFFFLVVKIQMHTSLEIIFYDDGWSCTIKRGHENMEESRKISFHFWLLLIFASLPIKCIFSQIFLFFSNEQSSAMILKQKRRQHPKELYLTTLFNRLSRNHLTKKKRRNLERMSFW